MARTRTLLSVATLLAVAAVPVAASPASARLIERGTFHDEYSEVISDFCDVEGLTVALEGVVDGRYQIVSKGRSRLPHFSNHLSRTETYTNVDTGALVTSVSNVNDKDLRITDNGDGTFTILVLATGSEALYNEDGKAIARNPGQVRFEVLIDNGGTPQDPFDDEFLEFLGQVKGSTGRSDDFCEAAVAEIG